METNFSGSYIVAPESHIARLVATCAAIRAGFTPDLLRQPYRALVLAGAPASTGHCYVATETCYHLLGARSSPWRPNRLRHEGSPHWFLSDGSGGVIDPTADQFETLPVYRLGVGCGFLTGHTPSKRTRSLLASATKHLNTILV